MTNEELFVKAYGLLAEQKYDDVFQICYQLDHDGYKESKHLLAWLYEQGLGITKNESRAFDLYLSAALDGNCVSQHGVAKCYEEGRLGVEKNYVQAYYWFSTAIECVKQNPEQECGAKSDLKKLQKLMTIEQINEANQKLKP